MKTYIIADTHFSHERVIKFCNRPFKDVIDMNNYIWRQWNSTVTNEDLVIHLGDFVWDDNRFKRYMPYNLKGRKVLVRGNHDKFTDAKYLNMGFYIVCDSIVINDVLFSHKPLDFKDPIKYNIHGHFHDMKIDRWEEELKAVLKPGHRLFNSEIYDFKPIELGKFLQGQSRGIL